MGLGLGLHAEHHVEYTYLDVLISGIWPFTVWGIIMGTLVHMDVSNGALLAFCFVFSTIFLSYQSVLLLLDYTLYDSLYVFLCSMIIISNRR